MKRAQLPVDDTRLNVLQNLCAELLEKGTVKDSWPEYEESARSVTPQEAMYLVDFMLQRESDLEIVKPAVSRMINLFSSALKTYAESHPPRFACERAMTAENERLRQLLAELRPVVSLLQKEHEAGSRKNTADRVNQHSKDDKDKKGSRNNQKNHQNQEIQNAYSDLKGILGKLALAHDHYVDKENILFPFIEKHVQEHRCLQLMWSIHDDVRNTLKVLEQISSGKRDAEKKELNKLLGRLFFDIGNMMFREEYVLLPAVRGLISEQEWERMEVQRESGYDGQIPAEDDAVSGNSVQLPTGKLTASQLMQIFNNLPVDITLVDADDKVVYFSTPEHRIFPRSPAVIGRDVRNCHSPESVGTVVKILTAFREKRKTKADFYLHVKDKYVYIQYLALYDARGEYDGVLEVLQEISGLQQIEGEKRLLDWE